MTQQYTQDDVDALMSVATQQISELMAERTKLESNSFNFEQAFYDVQTQRNELVIALKNLKTVYVELARSYTQQNGVDGDLWTVGSLEVSAAERALKSAQV